MLKRLQRLAGDAMAATITLIVVLVVTALILTDLLRSPGGQEVIDRIKNFHLLSSEPDDIEELRKLLEIQVANWSTVSEGIGIYAATRFSTPEDLGSPVYSWCVLQEQKEVGFLRREIVIAHRIESQEVEFFPILPEDAAAFGMSAPAVEDAARQHCRFVG